MKKFAALLLTVLMTFGLTACAGVSRATQADNKTKDAIQITQTDKSSVFGVEKPDEQDKTVLAENRALSAKPKQEVRAVWLAYVNYDKWIKNATKAQFTANMRTVMKNIKSTGFNTLFFQVRPFGDALYKSSYFPWSRYLTGTEGKDPGYDPLAITCALGKEYGINVEAWINPYRVRLDMKDPLAANNPAKKWLDAKSNAVVSWNGGLYYNPASPEARKLITDGVYEIVKNYDVTGIHFDDYFYPTTDMAFDAKEYKASGTQLSQEAWRRENVNILVRQVYAAVKKADPNCLFGISPQGNLQIDYEVQFIDVEKWLTEDGYIDYICPQIYYGFFNKLPFADTAAQWNALIKNDVKLYIGIAAYKLGTTDKWAGEAGVNEWIGTKDILARMVKTARSLSHYGGIAVYNYDSLYSVNTSQVKTELANLEKLFR